MSDLFNDKPVENVTLERIYDYDSIEIYCSDIISSNLYTLFFSRFDNNNSIALIKNGKPEEVKYFAPIGRAKGEVIVGSVGHFVNDSILATSDAGSAKYLYYYNLNKIIDGKTKSYEYAVDLNDAGITANLLMPQIVRDSIIITRDQSNPEYLISTINIKNGETYSCMQNPEVASGKEFQGFFPIIYDGQILVNSKGDRFASVLQNVDMIYFGAIESEGKCSVDKIYQYSEPQYTTKSFYEFSFNPGNILSFGFPTVKDDIIYATYRGWTKGDFERRGDMHKYWNTNLLYAFDFDGNPIGSYQLDKDLIQIYTIEGNLVGMRSGEDGYEYYKINL